ncbi:unnamed protein product [Jaminaea pallidilutea]
MEGCHPHAVEEIEDATDTSSWWQKRGRRRRSSERPRPTPERGPQTGESSAVPIDQNDNSRASGALDSEPSSRPQSTFGRSPAANFLSAFSSLNSFVEPSAQREWGSPTGNAEGSRSSSINASVDASRWRHLADSTGSLKNSSAGEDDAARRERSSSTGVGSRRQAALTDSIVSSASFAQRPLAPSVGDEGFRFGPNDRFQLGKVIGFGGFSSIREGWDDADEEESGVKRRIAVKLTEVSKSETGAAENGSSENELSIWRALPAHANILPLLYDAVLPWDPTGEEEASDRAMHLLVMPLCEGGNLMDYVKAEGGKRSTTNPPAAASAGLRSVSHRKQASSDADAGAFGSLQHTRMPSAQRNASVAPAAPSSSFNLSRTPSRTNSIRRGSSTVPRSQGVSVTAARGIVLQLAEALSCLHAHASVLHGDLKLENVLSESVPEDHTAARSWRLADFGLSQRIMHLSTDANVKVQNYFQRGAATDNVGKSPSDSRTLAPTKSASPIRNAKARLGAGSLAYTPPEVWREGPAAATPTGEQAVVSPFASDMWALGCIVHVLLSGKMPFSDNFEPRLQTKIAKGEWDMPPRLWRRARRLASAAAPASGVRQRESTNDGSGSLSRSVSGRGPDLQSFSRRSESLSSDSGEQRWQTARTPSVNRFSAYDLSASLPSLPDQDERAARILKTEAASAHEAMVVGSVPSRPTEPQRYEIDIAAQAAADAEADPESDDDTAIDQGWDGDSLERASARAVLRGLLEPEPAKRWTIVDLLASQWLSVLPKSEHSKSTGGVSSRGLANVTEGVPLGNARASPERSLWRRNKSSQTELAFGKVEVPSQHESKASSGLGATKDAKRGSSLTRLRPDGQGEHLRSTSIDQKGRSTSQSRADIANVDDSKDWDPEDSLIVHSGSSSPKYSHISKNTAPRSPASPVEIRGRRSHRVRNLHMHTGPCVGDVDDSEDTGDDLRELRPRRVSSARAIAIPGISHGSSSSTRSSSSGNQVRSQSTSRVPSSRQSQPKMSAAGSTMSPSSSIDFPYRGRRGLLSHLHQHQKSSASTSTSGSSSVTPLGSFANDHTYSQGDHRGSPTIEPTRASTNRSSTSRSRSRAPDALAQLLSSSSSSRSGSVQSGTRGMNRSTPSLVEVDGLQEEAIPRRERGASLGENARRAAQDGGKAEGDEEEEEQERGRRRGVRR